MGARLKHKVALITGAGRGIGRAIAEVFAREGGTVAGADHDRSLLDGLGSSLARLGASHVELTCDVTHAGQVQEAVDAALAAFGTIDVLVNNAGVSYIVPFLQMSEGEWDRTIEVNLRGTYLFCRAVLPHMVSRGRGKIINMSSQSGKKGASHYAAYCASKFGIIGLTQSLALEFAPHGITVNAVCPGVVLTPMWESMLPDYARKINRRPAEVKRYLESKVPMGRLAEADEVARVVLFLASEESNYMTGQAINVTGGSVMY